jgi:hypothetical protein
VTLIEAVAAALAAGAQVESAAHPFTLHWADESVRRALSEEAVIELLAADPERMDQALSYWLGLNEHMEHYRQAVARGDERNKAWWRQRLLEDYNYCGPFPDDPPLLGT